MESDFQIKISYQLSVPDDWMKEVRDELEGFKVKIVHPRNQIQVYNMHYGAIPDVVIYLIENPESVIIAPAVYSILESIIKKLLRKLKGKIKKVTSSKTTETKIPAIFLKYTDEQGRTLKFEFIGYKDPKTVETMVSSGMKILQSRSYVEKFADTSLPKEEDTSMMYFNESTSTWEYRF